MGKIVCFGELLLRFTASDQKRLLKSGALNVFCGGAEANVGVSLARFGHSVDMVSALPDNPLAHHIRGELQQQGVGIDHVLTRPGRVGSYYLEPGAVLRPSQIVYDRNHSAFAETEPNAYEWESILAGADILHVSGITPALGPNTAKAVSSAVEAAFSAGVKVSFDGNYRAALWKNWGGDGPEILKNILAKASIAFINEKDISLVFGLDITKRETAVEYAFDACPNLNWIAATERVQTTVTNQSLAGELFCRNGRWCSDRFELSNVVDRIGGGDAFASGVLHGLTSNLSPQETVNFATVASSFKHSIPGDFNLTSVAEIEGLMTAEGLDVRR